MPHSCSSFVFIHRFILEELKAPAQVMDLAWGAMGGWGPVTATSDSKNQNHSKINMPRDGVLFF
jgi:hypothetical protein